MTSRIRVYPCLTSLLVVMASAGCGTPSTTPTPGNDAGTSACSCDISYNGRSEKVACGTGTCFSADDRWAACTATGAITWGNRNCIQDAWDGTTAAPFDCDGTRTCPAGAYCINKVGPVPRRSECRTIPAGCTPPTDERAFADCLFVDAKLGTVCAGSPSLRTSQTYLPRAAELTCD